MGLRKAVSFEERWIIRRGPQCRKDASGWFCQGKVNLECVISLLAGAKLGLDAFRRHSAGNRIRVEPNMKMHLSPMYRMGIVQMGWGFGKTETM